MLNHQRMSKILLLQNSVKQVLDEMSKKVALVSQSSDCTCLSNVLTSYPALVISIAGEAELWDHDIGVAERHAPVDVRQLVEAVGALQHVLCSVPHAHIPAAGFLLQITHVYGLHEHPGGPLESGRLWEVTCHGKVHGDVVTVLRLVHQSMHFTRLLLEQLQEAPMEERCTH